MSIKTYMSSFLETMVVFNRVGFLDELRRALRPTWSVAASPGISVAAFRRIRHRYGVAPIGYESAGRYTKHLYAPQQLQLIPQAALEATRRRAARGRAVWIRRDLARQGLRLSLAEAEVLEQRRREA